MLKVIQNMLPYGSIIFAVGWFLVGFLGKVPILVSVLVFDECLNILLRDVSDMCNCGGNEGGLLMQGSQ